MQPARQDVVQNLTVPASTATATDFLAAMMSLPSWRPDPRASPKSSVYVTGPTSGKIRRGTPAADADAGPPSRTTAKRTTKRLRAVSRRGAIRTGFALEARHRSMDRQPDEPHLASR